jgi:AmmeMemoRadiSam system protein A
MFSNRQKETLRTLAANSIKEELGLKPTTIDTRDSIFREKSGVFVTLQKDNNLRGCIGSLTAQQSIVEGIKSHAKYAAFNDSRFSPVQEDELDDISIEISILTEPKPLKFTGSKNLLDLLQPDQDGVILRQGRYSATFLPQVWQQLPEPEQFMNHLAMKAGLPVDGWRQEGMEIETYSVIKF